MLCGIMESVVRLKLDPSSTSLASPLRDFDYHHLFDWHGFEQVSTLEHRHLHHIGEHGLVPHQELHSLPELFGAHVTGHVRDRRDRAALLVPHLDVVSRQAHELRNHLFRVFALHLVAHKRREVHVELDVQACRFR